MSQNAKIALSLLAVAVVLVGGYAYSRMKNGPSSFAVTSIPAAVTFAEHARYYDITANRPPSTPLSGGKNEDAVARMKQFVDDTIAQFKSDGNFDSLTPRDIQMFGYDKGRKQTLQILYMVSSSSRTVSYIFTVYRDTLGAHGNTDFKTFMFDLTTGDPLSLSDLFLPGSQYLNTLSSLSRMMLAQNMGQNADAAQINAGTEPVTGNFKDFFLDNGNLDLLFPPYQVGPYAAGSQTVAIPRAKLADILKPEYR